MTLREGGRKNQEKKEVEGESSRRGKALKPPTRVLNIIITIVGSSAKKRKAWEIASIGYGPPANRIKRANGSEVCFPHDNQLVITLKIGIMDVKRVVCDDGSNNDVFFADAFRGMKLKENKLTLV